MSAAGLPLVNTADNFRTVSDGLFRVESTLHMVNIDEYTYVFASHTLHENLGVLVDEDVRLSFLGIGEASLAGVVKHRPNRALGALHELVQHI